MHGEEDIDEEDMAEAGDDSGGEEGVNEDAAEATVAGDGREEQLGEGDTLIFIVGVAAEDPVDGDCRALGNCGRGQHVPL